ncbi:unnamed protein product [Symbiodinium sp. CCMP2456]|nr:unnamed protein product [Symbiodinium sp. CCMP2456]
MHAEGGLAVCIFSKTEAGNADKIVKDRAKTLYQLCGLRVAHLTSSKLIARCLEAKFVIFVATSKEAEEGLIYHASESHSCLDVGAFLSRLLGSYVGGPSWLDECVRRGRLLQPLLQLAPAMKSERQVGFDDSLPQQAAMLKVLAALESHTNYWISPLGHSI